MFKESEVAANWWGNILDQTSIHDNGEVVGSSLANFGRSKLGPLSLDIITNFKKNLSMKLDEEIAKNKESGDWKEDNPNWCSYSRANWMSIDYNVTNILKDVAIRSGISERELMFRFPVKTTMMINPGEVKVRHGYRADMVNLL